MVAAMKTMNPPMVMVPWLMLSRPSLSSRAMATAPSRSISGELTRHGYHVAHVRREQALGRRLEARRLPDLHAEGFDDAIAGDGFVQDVLNLGQLVLPAPGGAAHLASNLARAEHDDRHKQQQNPRQLAAHRNDQRGGKQKDEKLLQKLGRRRSGQSTRNPY